jgi:hypothetical protein
MRIKRILIAVWLCIAASPAVRSQSVPPPPPTPPSKAPPQALRVTARIVQVNVIVRDKKGVPVTGLMKSDFTIFDQGKPQEISSFEQQNNQATVTTASASAPNVFSNKFVEGTGRASIATVILLDAVNTAGFCFGGRAGRHICPGNEARRSSRSVLDHFDQVYSSSRLHKRQGRLVAGSGRRSNSDGE